MKWFALVILALAVIIRLTWSSSFALAIPVSATTHRGYPISSIVFWILFVAGFSLLMFVLVKESH
jgi:hypothetical protein